MKHLVALDGSLRPGSGNTARALDVACARWAGEASVDRISLAADDEPLSSLAARLRAADGLLLGSGTYWGSWGSPLQRFFEVMTSYEATDVFLGKPAAVVVTMDSTGGAEVASRLAATLACLGCLIPPFGWMALSRVGAALADADPEAADDVWGWADVEVIAENLLAAARAPRIQYRPWPIRRAASAPGAWRSLGPLPAAAPDFARTERVRDS